MIELGQALENLDGWISLYGADSPQVKLLRRLATQTEFSDDDQAAFDRLIDTLQYEAQAPSSSGGLRAAQVYGLLKAMREPKTGGTA